MYYAFNKSLIWTFLATTILVSLPCTLLVLVKLIEKNNLTDMATGYISKLSIGTLFENKTGKNLSTFLFDPNNAYFFADLVVYFNILGLVILIIASICLRKNLVNMHLKVDTKEVSPSDFAILVRNIPLSMTKKKL